jgi:hypothetical protein
MYRLRKLALCLLVLPLTLNGLWVLCRDVPPAPQAPDSAQAQSSDEDQQKAECERLCARQSPLCLVSAGDKTSVTIVVFGVAVFPTHMGIGAPLNSREPVVELCDMRSDPTLVHPSPPPKT